MNIYEHEYYLGQIGMWSIFAVKGDSPVISQKGPGKELTTNDKLLHRCDIFQDICIVKFAIEVLIMRD